MALLNSGGDMMARDRLGRTVLHLAALHNMPVLVEQLLALRIDPLVRDYNNLTPLDVAIDRDHPAILDSLVLSSGERIDREAGSGRRAEAGRGRAAGICGGEGRGVEVLICAGVNA
jgi:ankyrin repeat protein